MIRRSELRNLISDNANYIESLIRGFGDKLDDIFLKLREIGHTVDNIAEANVDCERLLDLTEMLTGILCDKYKKGTVILYDESDPRNITVIKDGRKIDLEKCTEVYFDYDFECFPTLEIHTS